MENFFHLKERGSTIRGEILGGITTFLAMAYILAVNPAILAECGMDAAGVFTATAISAALATLFMGVWANLPVALAAGMGLNSFFSYTIVLGMGYSIQQALTAVLIEGFIFLLIAMFNVRKQIMESIPRNIKLAISVGIGLFITLNGLANAGIVVKTGGTTLSLGAFEGTALVAIIGLALTLVLFARRIPGSILLGILLTTLIGIPFGVTKIPENFSIVSLPSMPLLFDFDFTGIWTFKFFTVCFTLLFLDVFDTIGTLLGVTEQGQLDEDGNIPRLKQALMVDAIGTMFGAMIGTSTVTSFAESTSGVAAGGRTGLSAIVTAIFFVLAIFLTPVFLLIPAAATAPVLVIVGYLMMTSMQKINFKDSTEGIPSFLCIIAMPFSFSISEGISWGIISYVILKTIAGHVKIIKPLTWILAAVFVAHYFI